MNTTPEPKKSARLAEKRKLREEGGVLPSPHDENFYFTPYFTPSSSNKRAPTPSSSSPLTVGESPSKTGGKTGGKIRSNSPKIQRPDHLDLNTSPGPARVSPRLLNSPTSTKLSPTTSKDPIRKSSSPSSSSANSFKSISQKKSPISYKGSKHSPSSSKNISPSSTKSGALKTKDEFQWLDTLEMGNSEESGEKKSPKLMTSRQRGLQEKKSDGTNMGETTSERTLSITPEMIRSRADKIERRRIQAQEKKEKDKKKTMERLLKKQQVKPTPKAKIFKKFETKLTYSIGPQLNTITFPPESSIPFEKPSIRPRIPEFIKCGVEGCENRKKYSCSKTQIPLCSLECYKKNLISHES